MVTKLTKAEVTELLSKNIDFQVIANILNDDVTEIKTYIRELLVTKIRH